MTTANEMSRTAKKFRDQPLVDDAWSADRGYVIAILYRPMMDEGSIFQLIDLAKQLDMDGEIRIVTDHLHKGQERDAIHFEHVDRTEGDR